MAATPSNEALKQQAIRDLQKGREEITRETHELRERLSPQHMAEKVLRTHTTGVIIAAAVAGVGLGLLIFRRRTEPVHVKVVEKAAPKKEPKTSKLWRLFEFTTPLVFNKLITPYIMGLLQKQQREPSPAPPAHPNRTMS